ncbi:DUF397 domain-containing protein [Actinomadura graeca]|uniref:DUF397 domain-containing protein n=1 Tax=Actinomadura graeca TaxID=2750812 RepID=A0ABX8QYE6_9ACTN|nr:DUF397 domain-containing protein [Actinomadura graeca]QXJ23795.1 DUF397 domain-containing protein [Actinomadura graeca]
MPEGVGIRDSKHLNAGYITLDRDAFLALLAHIKG